MIICIYNVNTASVGDDDVVLPEMPTITILRGRERRDQAYHVRAGGLPVTPLALIAGVDYLPVS